MTEVSGMQGGVCTQDNNSQQRHTFPKAGGEVQTGGAWAKVQVNEQSVRVFALDQGDRLGCGVGATDHVYPMGL